MSLDMYAFKVRKPNEKEVEKIKEAKSVEDMEWMEAIKAKDLKQCLDLKPFVERVTLELSQINIQKIKEDYQIRDDMKGWITAYGHDGILFCFENRDDQRHVSVSYADYDQKYSIKKSAERYAFYCRKVKSWRNENSLCNELFSLYDGKTTMANCGYLKCNQEMIDLMVKHGMTKPEEDDVIFLHCWW